MNAEFIGRRQDRIVDRPGICLRPSDKQTTAERNELQSTGCRAVERTNSLVADVHASRLGLISRHNRVEICASAVPREPGQMAPEK